MNNLVSMLSKSLVPGFGIPSPLIGSAEVDALRQICVKLPAQLVEYIRNFQHCEAMCTGNMHFSFKDALSKIIEEHQIANCDIPVRPASVKSAERKTGPKKIKMH